MRSGSEERMLGMVGLAGVAADGHWRMGSGEGFRVWAGSEAVHAEMLDWCVRIAAVVRERGQCLRDLTEPEFLEIVASLNDSQMP